MRTGVGRWVEGAVWVGAAGAAVGAAVRASGAAGRRSLGIGVQGLAPWVLLPAYPAAALAAYRRQVPLAAGLGALAAAHARWTAAEVGRPARGRKVPPLTPGAGERMLVGRAPEAGGRVLAGGPGVPLRVATANLLWTNPDPVRLVAGLTAAAPDVLLLQEVTPEILAALRSAGALDPYPHQVLDARSWVHGGAILSRLPLAGGRSFALAGSPLTCADVVTGGGPVRVVNVHLVAPIGGRSRVEVWAEQFAGLAALDAPAGGHLVLAGDFNATGQHRPMARLLAAGLRDAQRVAGGGLAPTWPTTGRPGFPVLRLDHVLVGPGVGVAGVRRGRGPGSDHRPLIADLVLPGPTPPW